MIMNLLTVLLTLCWSTLVFSAPAPTKTPAPDAASQEEVEVNFEENPEAVVCLVSTNYICLV